ncbi:MAG: hypothetical protein ACR2F6_02850 [Mycobacteriales bacterium]
MVIDAHIASSSVRIAAAARGAGVPFLVDPQTLHLQAYADGQVKSARRETSLCSSSLLIPA